MMFYFVSGCVAELRNSGHESWICDGVVDCPDFSDELYCPYCPEHNFHCGVGKQCIPKEKMCDGVADCGNGADEKGCCKLLRKGFLIKIKLWFFFWFFYRLQLLYWKAEGFKSNRTVINHYLNSKSKRLSSSIYSFKTTLYFQELLNKTSEKTCTSRLHLQIYVLAKFWTKYLFCNVLLPVTLAPHMQFAGYVHRYYESGYLVYQENGQVGKVCADHIDQTVEKEDIGKVLGKLGQSMCKLLEYKEIKDVQIQVS